MKKSPKQTVDEMAEAIKQTIANWKNLKESGCNDPGWPDGLNMNLLRNHVIYYKCEIKDLCKKHTLLIPPEAYVSDLPYTDNNYFAKPKGDRAKRIMSRPGWQCYNNEPIGGKYDERQLSLF